MGTAEQRVHTEFAVNIAEIPQCPTAKILELNPIDRSQEHASIASTKNAKKSGFISLGTKTTAVHVSGMLFVWMAEIVIRKCPNIQSVRLTPLNYKKCINGVACAMLRERDIEIVEGHAVPNAQWRGTRSPYHKRLQSFYNSFSAEEANLFQELLFLEITEAKFFARYLCLGDENFITQREIGEKHGFPDGNGANSVSEYIKAFMSYMRPSQDMSPHSKKWVRQISGRVYKLRKEIAEKRRREKIASELGLQNFPEILLSPYVDEKIFRDLLFAKRDGEIDQWMQQKKYRRIFHALQLRYGLYGIRQENFQLMAYDDIGAVFQPAVSKQNADQMVRRALKKMGIER